MFGFTWNHLCLTLQVTVRQSCVRQTVAVSQFRVWILWRTRPLWSLKARPSQTLLTSSAVVKWDGLALEAFGDVLLLRHDFCRPGPHKWRPTPGNVAIFSLSFLFFGCAKNLGICEAMKDRSGASSRNREKKEHLEEPSDWGYFSCLVLQLISKFWVL